MIIECDEDPWKIIGDIGNPYFSICDDSYDEIYRHDNHPNTIRIIDCEYNQTIDVTGESIEDTYIIARSICILLNQNYYRPGVREK